MENNRKYLIYIMQPCFWMSMTPIGYLGAYSLQKGLTSGMLSTILAFFYAASFIGQFFWGSLCDRIQTNKKIFLPVYTAAIINIWLIFLAPSTTIFIVLYILEGFLMAPMGSIVDSWILKLLDYDGNIYGTARGLGSAGYAVAMLSFGLLIARAGYTFLPIAATILWAITMFLSLRIPERKVAAEGQSKLSMKDFTGVMRNPAFLLLMATVFFIGMAISAPNNLKIVLLQNIGSGVSMQGVDNCIGCAIQSLTFILAGRLHYENPYKMFTLSIGVTALGILCALAAQNVWMIFLSTAMIYGIWSVEITVVRMIVRRLVPPQLLTTANSISDAAMSQCSGFISLLLSSAIMTSFGLKALLIICIGEALAAVVLSRMIAGQMAASEQ